MITSYFPIEFLPSIFSSFFVQWFFPQPCRKNLAWILQQFLLLLLGFLLIFTLFSLIFGFNTFIPKISSPILLFFSKSTFKSSQLNSWCDNPSFTFFAPCASLCNIFFKIAPYSSSANIRTLFPPRLVSLLTYTSLRRPFRVFFTFLTSIIM